MPYEEASNVSENEKMTLPTEEGSSNNEQSKKKAPRRAPGSDTLSIDINMFDYDDDTKLDFPADMSSDNITLVVWVGDNSDVSTVDAGTPWAVIDANNLKGNTGTFTVSIDKFNSNGDYASADINYSDLSSEQKSKIRARLIHSSKSAGEISLAALRNKLYDEAQYTQIWNGGFDGYGISSKHSSGLLPDGRYEINFKKSNAKAQDVVFKFSNGSEPKSVESGYYVMLKALKYNGNPEYDSDYYYYVVPVEIDGSSSKVTIPITGNWSDNQQFSDNWTDLTATVIKKANGDIKTGGNKPNDNSYSKAYVIGEYKYTYEGLKEESDNDNHIDHKEFTFVLEKADYDDALTPEDVTGPGVNYGITADEFHQAGHLQSNFATNNYSGEGNEQINVQPDLSNQPGTSVASKITGTIFYNEPGGANIITNPEDESKIGGHTDNVTIETAPEALIKALIVDPIINHGQAMSDNLLRKETTFTPESNNLDLTQFPDGKTIYIDGDKLAPYFATEVKISMLSKQTVVFNFGETESLKLGKVLYVIPGVGDDPAGKEHIAEHVVYNCASVKNLEIADSYGMYLVPQKSSKTTVTTSSEGWIITGGRFENVSLANEWHFRYQKVKSTHLGDLEIEKKFAGSEANKLTDEQKSNIEFTITISNNEDYKDFKETFTYADMTGGKKTLKLVEGLTYTVTETNAAVDGLKLVTKYKIGSGAENTGNE